MVKDLVLFLRTEAEISRATSATKQLTEAADLLERIYSQPVELPFSPYLYTEWTSESDKKCSTMYTADQLTKAVQEATARALEAAAVAAEKQARWIGYNAHAEAIADAIRNLIGKVK